MNKYILSLILMSLLSCGANNSKKKSDNILKIGIDSEIRSIDPRYATDANSQYLENLINCSLISFNKEGQVQNRLAKSMKWINPKKLEVEINDETFSNGSKVLASDVKGTYEFFLNEKIKEISPRRGAFKMIDSIETIGDKKVIFNLKNPDATFAGNLVVGILPTNLAARGKIKDYKNLIGCGAFKIDEKGFNSLNLIRRSTSKAKVNSIVLKVIKDESTRLAKLLKGELDIVQNSLGREQAIKAAQEKDYLSLARRSGLNTTYIGFNFKDKILKKPEVRKAINLAINRSEIIKFVLKDFGTEASSLLTPGNVYKAVNKTIKMDLGESKRLLDQAGFKPDKNGVRLKLEYKTTTNTTRVVIAKAIASQLKKIGIDVTVKSMDWGKFKQDVEKGHVQMWSLTWIGFKDPDIYRYVFATESFPPNGGNRGWFSSPKLDKLLEQGKIETDVAKRKLTYKKVEEIIQNELPYSYLWHQDVFALVNNRVKGFELYADGRLQSLENVHLE